MSTATPPAERPDLAAIRALCGRLRLSPNAGARRRFGVPLAEVTAEQAAALLAALREREDVAAPPSGEHPAPALPRQAGPPVSPGQLGLLRRLARECRTVDVAATCRLAYGCNLESLSLPEASQLIDECREAERLAALYPEAFAP